MRNRGAASAEWRGTMGADAESPHGNWIRTWENGSDYIECLDGIMWGKSVLPRRWHYCTPQTRGWIGVNYTERCNCGAWRDHCDEKWIRKNETRDHRKRDRRLARLPLITVTCGSCGKDYEAHEGAHQAAE